MEPKYDNLKYSNTELNNIFLPKQTNTNKEDRTYLEIVCTCTEKCSYACKGTCGCEACRCNYNDFLSGE